MDVKMDDHETIADGELERLLTDMVESISICQCSDKYSIEKHGNGHALYFGRCDHKHGYNVLHITSCHRQDIFDAIVKGLNNQKAIVKDINNGHP